MTLYEIATDKTGESYVRAYAWANDEAEARRLFADRNPRHVVFSVRALMRQDDVPFCTTVTDHGWLEEGE